MTIQAFLNQDEDKEIQEVAELTPEAYKGLATSLSIDKAEQSIIEEVTGVDGDEEGSSDAEREELEEEQQMRSLFQSLYEIDPETNEVFVKGSAYDLKKWDEDMICFTFGNSDQVIALESAISPGERYLAKMHAKIETKQEALVVLVRKHANSLRAKTISRQFAADFKEVMGYPIPNIRMESFTKEPTSTNYAIAMEEMNAQQMALAGAAGIAGIALVYKLIQWFSKSLNKNSDAVGGIANNFSAYKERKQKIETAPQDLELDKQTVDKAVDDLLNELNSHNVKNPTTVVSELKSTLSGASANSPAVYNSYLHADLSGRLAGKATPFHVALLNGKVKQEWWSALSDMVKHGLECQNNLVSALETISSAGELDKDKPVPIDFNFLEAMNKLKLYELTTGKPDNFVTWDKNSNNWDEAINSFMGVASGLTTALADAGPLKMTTQAIDSIASIDLTAFQHFSSDQIDKLEKAATVIKEQSERAYKDMQDTSNKKDARVENRRDRVNLLVKEFKAVSQVVRFAIMVRNQLGAFSVALKISEERAFNFLGALGAAVANSANFVSNSVNQVAQGFNNKLKR